MLTTRYDTIDAFNRAWGMNLSGWPVLLEQPFQPTGELNAAAGADMRAFIRALAGQYFRTVRYALKKYDPNHLYLGSRFAWYTQETVEACAEFCDTLSFNIYRPRVEHAEWSFLDNLGKPVMVGE